MGQAKRRQQATLAGFDRLDHCLRGLGVDTTQFGFYDQETFLACERADPRFLENYATWVALRPRDESYDRHVRDVVPRLTEIVSDALRADGWEGGCVAGSSMMTRMLDRMEVWSFGVAGSTTFEVEGCGLWRGLCVFDDQDFPGAVVGHSWVVAPPYRIVDPTIALQHWSNDRIEAYVPRMLVVETEARTVRPRVKDMVSTRVQARYAAAEHRRDRKLHHRLCPELQSFGRRFPALETEVGDMRIRYVPVGIHQSDVPLDQINTEGGIGRPASQIWQDEVAPAFRVAA